MPDIYSTFSLEKAYHTEIIFDRYDTDLRVTPYYETDLERT